jgi:uncharacterized Zn finger protein
VVRSGISVKGEKTRVAPPQAVEATCPHCGEHATQQVKKGHVAKKGAAVEGTFTCEECGHTHQGLIDVPVPVEIPLLVSDEEGKTEPMAVQVLDEENVQLGDEFEVEEALVEITSVELSDARRVEKAPAKDIKTLWGKDITQVKVSFAMNVGSETRAFEAHFDPEDSIAIGDKFDLDETEVEVKQIVTDAGKRRHGRHNVREIRRVWLKRHGRDDRQGPPRGRTTGATKRPQGGRSGQRSGTRTGGGHGGQARRTSGGQRGPPRGRR